MNVYTVDVGFTDRRPIQVDQYVSRVTVAADTDAEATTLAALMVMRPACAALGLRDVQMPTSTRIVAMVL